MTPRLGSLHKFFLERSLRLATPENFTYEDDTFRSAIESDVSMRRERMIRLVFVLRRKPNLTRAEFQQYWRDVHGPLVAKHSTTLNILRYIQLHTLDDPMNSQLAGARGTMEPPYDGVAELWWTNREALGATTDNSARQSAAKELLE